MTTAEYVASEYGYKPRRNPLLEQFINDPLISPFVEYDKCFERPKNLDIKQVIFNNPATIVFWNDGSKTVVKCSSKDEWDPEKGLAMAFMKKYYGNKSAFRAVFKTWIPYI